MKKRNNMFRFIVLSVVLSGMLSMLSVSEALATHFRYGHLSWEARQDLGTNTVEFTLFDSFRRNGYSGLGADGRPVTGDIIRETIGGTSLRFGDSASTGTLDYLVIGFDITNNWIFCKALADRNNVGLPIIHTYSGPGPWNADISSCCRISPPSLHNNGNGNYRVLSVVDLSLDTCTAVSSLPPIVNVQQSGTQTFSVPAADADGDTLFWRLATPSEASGTGSYSLPPGFSINSSTGLVSWNTTGLALGLWTAQVIIEARAPGTNTFKSQVAVDFLLNLTSEPPPGTTDPAFIAPTPACGTTFDWTAGKNLNFTVRTSDADAGDSVSLNVIGLPVGATMTPGLPVGGNPVSSTFDWTPTVANVGPHVIIFTATDNTLRQVQCSFIVDVKVDTDGDGLPDDWETNGYSLNGNFVDLPTLGADPNHKDIFVEIDYMENGHSHLPNPTSISTIVASFANAPVSNPDGINGINLHVDVDDALAHQNSIGAFTPNNYDWTDFDAIKVANFDEARSLSFHYCVFAHNIAGSSVSGISRGITASDFIVSLGSWTGSVGTMGQQAGTFMHEFGHNLSLRHGGGDNINRKPNYLSVMTYAFQTIGLRINGSLGNYDYSRFNLPILNENSLNENVGLNGGAAIATYGTTYYCGGAQQWVNNANGPIDWDCSGGITNPVSSSINREVALQTLNSFDDWANLNYKGGLIGAGVVLDDALPMETPKDEDDIDTFIDDVPPAPLGITGRAGRGGVARIVCNPVGPTSEFTYNLYTRLGGGGLFALSGSSDAPAFQVTIPTGVTKEYLITCVSVLGGAESDASDIIAVTGR